MKKLFIFFFFILFSFQSQSQPLFSHHVWFDVEYNPYNIDEHDFFTYIYIFNFKNLERISVIFLSQCDDDDGQPNYNCDMHINMQLLHDSIITACKNSETFVEYYKDGWFKQFAQRKYFFKNNRYFVMIENDTIENAVIRKDKQPIHYRNNSKEFFYTYQNEVLSEIIIQDSVGLKKKYKVNHSVTESDSIIVAISDKDTLFKAIYKKMVYGYYNNVAYFIKELNYYDYKGNFERKILFDSDNGFIKAVKSDNFEFYNFTYFENNSEKKEYLLHTLHSMYINTQKQFPNRFNWDYTYYSFEDYQSRYYLKYGRDYIRIINTEMILCTEYRD